MHVHHGHSGFTNLPAIPLHSNNNNLDPRIVSPQELGKDLTCGKYMNNLSSTYASSMSDAVTTQFFHPETVRHRLETHQYKESDNVQYIRKLDNLYLVEFQECRLKNIKDYKKALQILFATKVRD